MRKEERDKIKARRDALVARVQELEDALQKLEDRYIASKGTSYEFVKCVTPNEVPDYWKNAIAVLNRQPRQSLDLHDAEVLEEVLNLPRHQDYYECGGSFMEQIKDGDFIKAEDVEKLRNKAEVKND